MKLLCINAKIIKPAYPNRIHHNNGTGLKEGVIYETFGKAYIDQDGKEVYFIHGLGAKLKCRFTEALQTSFISKKPLEEIALN